MNEGRKQTLSWFQRNLFNQRRKSRSYEGTIYLIMYMKRVTKFNITRVKKKTKKKLGENVYVDDYKTKQKSEEETVKHSDIAQLWGRKGKQ